MVISSPSGAGKTSISRGMIAQECSDHLMLSVSATTRPRRPFEIEGVHYHFMDKAQFDRLCQRHAFLEHAHVYGYHYGTLKEPVTSSLQKGQDVLFDIDWQGAQALKRHHPHHTVSLFILPPSLKALEQRLKKREHEGESQDNSAYRLQHAEQDIARWRHYDYVLINDDLSEAIAQARAILAAERLKRQRLIGMESWIHTLHTIPSQQRKG